VVTVLNVFATPSTSIRNAASVADDRSGGVDPRPSNNTDSDSTPVRP
jgi:hypothetical protein